jgi:hypothetical protein
MNFECKTEENTKEGRFMKNVRQKLTHKTTIQLNLKDNIRALLYRNFVNVFYLWLLTIKPIGDCEEYNLLGYNDMYSSIKPIF